MLSTHFLTTYLISRFDLHIHAVIANSQPRTATLLYDMTGLIL